MQNVSKILMDEALNNAKEIGKLTNETIKKDQSCNGYLKLSYSIPIAELLLYILLLILFVLIHSKLKTQFICKVTFEIESGLLW